MGKLVSACVCALLLTACATVSYLRQEYGSAPRDGEVRHPASGMTFHVWQHKSKPKLMIVVSPGDAAAMGAVSGLTFGAAGGAVPPPVFEEAAAQWLKQAGGRCRTAGGHPIDRTYYEFNIVCQ